MPSVKFTTRVGTATEICPLCGASLVGGYQFEMDGEDCGLPGVQRNLCVDCTVREGLCFLSAVAKDAEYHRAKRQDAMDAQGDGAKQETDHVQ